MAPSKNKSPSKSKKNSKALDIGVKVKIIDLLKGGEKVASMNPVQVRKKKFIDVNIIFL